MNPKIEVKSSPIHGRGLFAKKSIRRGEWVGRYEGKRTTRNGMHVLWIYDTDGSCYGVNGANELRYLNHARPANCELDDLELYATRLIRPGEEMFIDYGDDW